MNYRNLSKEEYEELVIIVDNLFESELKKEALNSLILKKQTSNRVSKCNKKKK
ncbi:MAG: hypothetical protein ACRDD7_08255 [Peptostreptococcaceae bacterium]